MGGVYPMTVTFLLGWDRELGKPESMCEFCNHARSFYKLVMGL